MEQLTNHGMLDKMITDLEEVKATFPTTLGYLTIWRIWINRTF